MSPQDTPAKVNMNEPDKSENDGNPPNFGDKAIRVEPDLFKGVQFCICDDVDAAEEVKKILVEGGGKLVNYLSDIATHLIANNPDHQDVCQALEIYEKPVVTSRWVWLSAKAGCLLPTAAFSPLKNRLMSGVVACPSNLQREDLDALWAMITYHGGHFQINLDKMCSHLISGKAEGVKYEKALTMSDKIKIVTPDWVIDSIKGKALCDEELYHPKLLILPGDKVETKTETSITPVSIHDTMNMITTTISEQQSNTVTTSAPSTQVTLRTVSLPPSTMVTSVSTPGLGQQARPLRVLVPSQNQELNPVAPQQSGQPRQVYLALQQPQIRQQQVNLAQVRQHVPRGPVTEGVQPVKPIILQQRIQPPALQQVQPQQQPPQPQQNHQLVHQPQPAPHQIHQQQTQVQQPPQIQRLQQQQQQQQQQQPQQYQQLVQQHYPPLKDGQTGVPISFQNQQQPQIQSHPQQQIQQSHQSQSQPQPQSQQLQHPHSQMQLHMQQQQQQQQPPPQQQQPQQQQQQFTQIQQQSHLKPQYIQNQQYLIQNQQPHQNQAQQPANQIAFKMGAPPNYSGSTGMVSPGVQYVNTMNQNQTVQDPNQQIRFLQGQQMNQGQRQVIPVQQRPPLMQQIQSGQQIMRAPIQQTQVFSGSPPTNQDNMMQDMQQPNSVQMVQNQQFVQIQRHNPPQMVNVSQHNGPHLIRTPSPQQVVYQHQGPLVGPHQRPVMQGMQQVLQPGTPIYNQQGQQVAVGSSQVQRVPQLRMQPNFQQMPRGQFRGPVQSQQVVTGGPPRNFIRQQVPVQGQLIPRQGPPPVQYSQHFSQQASHIGSQQPQPTPPLHDQQHLIPNQIPAQHPQHPGVQLETQAVQKPNQNLIRGQANQNWNQQWTPTTESPMIPNQRLLIRSPSNNVLIAQQNGPGTPQILHSPQHDGARKQLPFGNQTPIRIMHTVGQRFPIANQASDSLKQHANLAPPLNNVRSLSTTTSSNTNTSLNNSNSPGFTPSSPAVTTSLTITPPSITSTCASAVVTPKTKTTLANFLNTRLQNNNASIGASVKLSNEVNSAPQTPSSQSHAGDGSSTFSSVSNLPHSSGCTSVSITQNKTGYSGASGVVLPNGELIPSVLPPIEPQPERLFGHEPRILVPPSFCLIGCVFYFVEAEKNICNFSEERLESCKKIVQKYGGEMENTYSDKCTHVICETQQNPIVKQAIKEGKRCVTIFWLNDIIIEGRMRPPYKIWHLPRTFDGDFLPCRDHIITLTNFEGNERVFVKELIKVTGAQYTNYLNHKNTIIICKKLEGPKFRKALQWDMPAVNLIWLQDILFGHHNQALSALRKSSRYSKFESKDCCEIDYNLVKHLLIGWKVPLKVPEDLPRRIMALKEEDVKKRPPSVSSTSPTPVQTNQSTLPLPPPPSLPPPAAPSSLPSAQQQSPPTLPPIQQQSPPQPPPLPSSIPPSSSSATIEAMEIDQTLDASKPVPTLIAKKPDNPINALASLDLNDKDSLTNEPTMKKVKLEPSSEVSPNENLTGNLPPPPPLMVAPFANASPDRAAVKVMFTGFNDASTLAELKEYAKKLGLTLINEYNKCTHLIVNRIVRTSKFMCAFNYADHILTSDWIVDSFKRSHLLDESQYILSDHKGEQLYGFDLKESLERRKARKTPLFKDHVFYITRSCLPSFKILKEIAESAGATVTKKGPSPKQLHALKKRRNDIVFVVISKEEDLHTCDLFFEKETPVLNSEFILHSLLRQQIEYEPYTFKPR